ncbi:DEAD/DEAH box helicase, partial [Rhodopila sp.]|uniref:DEAD/DEAH box helicase n=1 Tax=Rhodopila sp. TaxID=2480087 RepID=UPI0038D009BA
MPSTGHDLTDTTTSPGLAPGADDETVAAAAETQAATPAVAQDANGPAETDPQNAPAAETPAAETAAVAPTAETAAVAPTAETAAVAPAAETADVASTAETAAVAPTAETAAAPDDAAPQGTDASAEPADSGDEEPEAEETPAELQAEPERAVFSDLGLSEEVLRAIADMGYRHPTPIQEQAIPFVLMGRDVLGTAQTGTGKTASFTLPLLDILSGSRARARMPRSLILEPTRELALQVAENFVQYGKYLKLTHALIIGGESMSDQKEILNRGVDVLIATPGRLLDMFDRGSILLSDTRVLVIDEADRMLDMGFIPDVERIVSLLPATRQTLFFSATMGPEIRRLADAFLRNPKEIAVSRAASVATTITEGLVLVAEHDKREALRRLVRQENVQNALIFCNRKRDVDILYKSLTKHRFVAGALHGDMAQTLRFATLERFKANELRLLVCSDVAARGIDIGGLSHVFNFDVPIHAEDYVHRIGRTGRAGLEGKAFTIACPEDRFHVEQIEKLIGHPIPPVVVEGLDPVDWAEKAGRRRRSGKADKETKKTEPKERRDRSRTDRTDRADRTDRPDADAAPARRR